MADIDFSGRSVLVVGGSSGIGNGIARSFLQRGATVHVWGTRPSAADYASEPGSDLAGLHYACVDASDAAAVAAAGHELEQLDVLVLCQGTVIYRRGEFEMAGFEKVVSVNLNSMMACALRFQPQLARAKGSLILISSTAAYRTTLGNPAYNASKAALLGLTRSLAHAWIGDGIRVNGVAPGLVDTKLTKVTMDNPDRREWAMSMIPAKRVGTPEDIAGAVLFLASPLAGYVIGQTIVVDGGAAL
ncbi:MAG: SDR family oxidoreductase [Rhizorhabdus sp.]|uniref:SDR family NAD(P)-dependent oxidoreductase n=1 Tax=Rhizorhabdus sp. TaxID=1968843 RepID=UPI001B4D59C8|nr:SDR family oxidoreductase [Rhizorhabdus sp.]MBP8235565.1 SDR family oxidoreductase [Rhizorhabdus sp.]